jgi:hypothetical protein
MKTLPRRHFKITTFDQLDAIVRASSVCSKYAELNTPGVSTTTVGRRRRRGRLRSAVSSSSRITRDWANPLVREGLGMR